MALFGISKLFSLTLPERLSQIINKLKLWISRICRIFLTVIPTTKHLLTLIKVRYGDNQHTKVTTSNMVPANTPDPEDNPEDINVTIEDIEEDTGLTQKPIIVNPTPPTKEVPGTDQCDRDLSPWSDEDKVSNSEYTEQPDDPDENPGSSSQVVSNTAN